MKNPYVSKFAKAFNVGLMLVAFVMIIALIVFNPKDAHASVQEDLPIVCFSTQEFSDSYKEGVFKIVGKDTVAIFINGEATIVDRIITEGFKKTKTIRSTWLVENSGKFCLVFMEVLESL